MGRIPEAELERLKREVSLEALVAARGVELRKAGADLIGKCPFHDDHEPSLVISPAKNLWHCLGACQIGGTVIDWVMRAEGVSFRFAVQMLRGAAQVEDVTTAIATQRVPLVDASASDQVLLREVVSYYHATLKQSPEALAYLEKRGLQSAEAIDQFQLGYANRTLGLRLPLKERRAGGLVRQQLQVLGIMRESGHEHLAGSLVIPILDAEGRVTGMYGRKLRDDLREGTLTHLYLPGQRGVWNEAALMAGAEVIVCEALIDALTFWCAGYRNVVTAYGVEGFTSAHMAALKRHGTKRVLIAYDRDDAGDAGAAKLSERLMAERIECFRVEFPRGMDANEYALKLRPAEKSLGLALRRASWLGKGPAPSRDEPIDCDASSAKDAETAEAKEGMAPSETAADASDGHSEPAVSFPSLAAGFSDIPAQVSETEINIGLGDRRYRIRGLTKNLGFESLRVNLLCGRGEAFHVDTLDLYSARQRAAYIKVAAQELGIGSEIVKHDLAKVLGKLEAIQEEHIKTALKPKEEAPQMTESEREEAMALLKEPKLIERILADFARCGVVGEETGKLIGYLAATSRKLEAPLAVIIQSASAAGKTSLMEAIVSMMPSEERVQYSAMTGQSLFYMGETDLKHKILAIVEEEGAERASYALKLLQSEGELTIASTGKDPTTGRLVTHEYRVEGPVSILLTTTTIDLDEELQNRCLVVSVSEQREQTRAIHAIQRERQTLDGLLAAREGEHIRKLHQNAQRLLRPVLVANPYAQRLTFLDDRTRTRRDHMKYLTLIRTIALLHQYQREVQVTAHNGGEVSYIEVTVDDIAMANGLAHEVLGRSLDELAPQTRRLLLLIDEMVSTACAAQALRRGDYRFTRRALREHTGWGNTQLKVHLGRLEELEYVAVHRGAGAQGFVYELVYEGQGKDGTPFLAGLIDVGTLRDYDAERSGVNGPRSGVGRPLVGPESGGGRASESAQNSIQNAESDRFAAIAPETAHLERRSKNRTYILRRRDQNEALTSLVAALSGPSGPAERA